LSQAIASFTSEARVAHNPEEGPMRIDCTECEMYGTEHCDDCLVSVVLHPPAASVDIDDDLDPPLQALTGGGLIPVLKFRARASREPRAEAG
jgi:hypothetical protein